MIYRDVSHTIVPLYIFMLLLPSFFLLIY